MLLTGASGGLGHYIAYALAERKVKLALVAYPGDDLEALCNELLKRGVEAIWIVADLRVPEQRISMLEQVRTTFGNIDILVNNAGVEYTSLYHDLSEDNIREILNVNLEAPMILSHMVLPEMLKRRSGHIVNISSLAGKLGSACQEPYSASKAGLVAFTSALRASYRGTGVSASVICPGFVETGIYTKLKENTGFQAPLLLGTSHPELVARKVIRSIERDLPEVVINRYPVKPIIATMVIAPQVGEFLLRLTGAHDFFGKVAAALKQKHSLK